MGKVKRSLRQSDEEREGEHESKNKKSVAWKSESKKGVAWIRL